MENDDLFGDGDFGTVHQQQPFTFDTDEMNPFGTEASPWDDVTQPDNKRPETSSSAADFEESQESTQKTGELAPSSADFASVESAQLHKRMSDKLRVSTSSDGSTKEGGAQAMDTQTSETLYSADSSQRPSKDGPSAENTSAIASPSKKPASGSITTPVQTARRVGIIKRGLRSPRVFGKTLSPAAFEDPLSSAAARNDTDEPSIPAALSSQARASVDVSPVSSSKHNAVQTRQTRSLSDTRPPGQTNAEFADGSSVDAQHPSIDASSQHHNPHPYDQQLSPPLQQEQIISAKHHVEEGSRPRASTSSDRASVGASGPPSSRASISRAYMTAHQRRKSLDPTPADQMPRFSIRITDPVKVSDSLKSYIAYKVYTQSDAKMFRESNMVVRRRYRDFDWLIQELAARHPGIIVPPIPEKQSMGRFEDEFVEARRAGLESCLARISEHPVLWCDSVFRIFLEADDFATKARNITETRVSMEISGKGSQLGVSSGSGLFGDGWGSTKYKEKDEWFTRRMQELDAIEEELRALLRALDYSQRQRQELSIAHGELGEAYLNMAGQELSKNLSNGLTDMGSLQQKLKVLQSRQGVADFAGFQLTTDEYIRMIGAARTAFAARGRAHTLWQNSLSELLKKRRVLESYVQSPGKASAERITQLKGEIARAEIRTEGSRNEFDDVSQIIKQEVTRFDTGRVRDFQATVESYLTSLIETQEEIVVLWESYLASLRNADASSDRRASA
ncbi:Vacuolar protein sorting-associated protein vps5 [Coemansia sp. RSA 1813]|nr:Vacuolar protein sorting-associated protein vps5 [Coemansia sp. RSA 1646]KAJ1770627.1 Vacuolar protein sorting-associated protein vps5 [Coemansia sp. RSA 1843]KAJ2093445.1 Vacuolar protein sorting-associated protein vps5 [Coemansia sp. RSA 986]KAJ2217253.1 Vacuolar protein sorting-associated protein vps5 [Coemansia sp. RSA 487]KAJ2572453.1 Vacuolar protein sorting-associated protein vps5 [Coemansia sp. RSA 1813]